MPRRERAQALSQLACEPIWGKSLSDAFQVGTTLLSGNLALPLPLGIPATRERGLAVGGSALLTPDVASS